MVSMKSTNHMASTQLLWVSALLVAARLLGVSAAGSCPNCDIADSILKPCNTSLQMSTWPGIYQYQPTHEQAPCACNKNYYDQVQACVTCQSSETAKLTIKPLDDYKLVCQAFGQADFPAIRIPGQSSSSTGVPAPTGTGSPSPGHSTNGSSTSHSSLSSGAVAGIVVSAIALIVALAVAAYVFTRRRRDLARQKEQDEMYKYHEGTHDSYMEAPVPQYSGIHSSLPAIPQVTNLRVMNPDNDEEEERIKDSKPHSGVNKGFEVPGRASPGWRRGSFDDD